MLTRLKITFINTVIVLGSLAIVWIQWPEAMKPKGYGGGYDQGLATSIYLAVLLTGIPVLLYAVAVHVGLSHWLFQPGELKAYRARKLIESFGGKDTTGNPSPGNNNTAHNSLD
jgi:hypothetical protein